MTERGGEMPEDNEINALRTVIDVFVSLEPGPPGRRPAGNSAGIPGKSWRAALPFRRVRARPAPSRTAGCRGWCAEREAPHASSLLDLTDLFHESFRPGAPGTDVEGTTPGLGKEFVCGASLSARWSSSHPLPYSRMWWLVRRKGSAVCELAAPCLRLFQSATKTRMGILFQARSRQYLPAVAGTGRPGAAASAGRRP